MESPLQKYQRELTELAWQDRVRLLAAENNRPIPQLPLPKEASVIVQLLSHKNEEHGSFDLEQKERVYFFCAYYTLPKTYKGGWLGWLDKGRPIFFRNEKIKPEPSFLYYVIRELAPRFPCFGHKSLARYTPDDFCYFHILPESGDTETGIPLVPQIPEDEVIARMQNWDSA